MVASADMTLASIFKGWWSATQRLPLDEMLSVEFDNEGVRVQVLARLEHSWNQVFGWNEVARVCFKTNGLHGSDSILVQLRHRDLPVVIPVDARGGSAFCGTLCERGLFPGEIWREAVGDISDRTHCWPPDEK